jgi:diguanylate cyclase (GGDEF)-like protein
VGIAELDAEGYCRYLNPVGCALNACDENAARGRHFFEFVHPDDRDYVEFVWQLNATHEEANWLEFRLRDTAFWVSAHWINRFEAGQRLTGSIIIFIDSTQQRCRDQQVWTQAHYDALTGLPNRSLFWERLSQSLLRARRDHQNMAVLWIDLDGFKAVNDHWGHAAGDELLQQVALCLSGRMRDSDTVARMGGDEFAVILSDLVEGGAAEPVAANLAVRLAEPFVLGCGTSEISASIGVALYPLHAKDAETLVKYADMAMYAAKRAGKNQVTVWRPDLGETLEELSPGDERGSRLRMVPQQIDHQ